MELGWILSALMAFMMLAYGSTTVTIKRDGCGCKKLCNSEPAECGLAGTTDCWFGSVAYKDVSASKKLLHIQVSGKETLAGDKLALGLKLDDEEKASVFVCTPAVDDKDPDGPKPAKVSVYNKTVAIADAAKDKTITITVTDVDTTVKADEVKGDKDATSNMIRCQFNVTMDKDVSKIAIFLGTVTDDPGPVTVKMGLTDVKSIPTTVESTPGAGAGLFPSHVFALLMAVLTVFIMNRA